MNGCLLQTMSRGSARRLARALCECARMPAARLPKRATLAQEAEGAQLQVRSCPATKHELALWCAFHALWSCALRFPLRCALHFALHCAVRFALRCALPFLLCCALRFPLCCLTIEGRPPCVGIQLATAHRCEVSSGAHHNIGATGPAVLRGNCEFELKPRTGGRGKYQPTGQWVKDQGRACCRTGSTMRKHSRGGRRRQGAFAVHVPQDRVLPPLLRSPAAGPPPQKAESPTLRGSAHSVLPHRSCTLICPRH